MRVVPADALLRHFSSDRSHMLQRLPDGSTSWLVPPPAYPCIQASESGCAMNLHRYRDVRSDVLLQSRPEVAWSDVARAARSSRFGVVVPEEVLLHCLLGQQP